MGFIDIVFLEASASSIQYHHPVLSSSTIIQPPHLARASSTSASPATPNMAANEFAELQRRVDEAIASTQAPSPSMSSLYAHPAAASSSANPPEPANEPRDINDRRNYVATLTTAEIRSTMTFNMKEVDYDPLCDFQKKLDAILISSMSPRTLLWYMMGPHTLHFIHFRGSIATILATPPVPTVAHDFSLQDDPTTTIEKQILATNVSIQIERDAYVQALGEVALWKNDALRESDIDKQRALEEAVACWSAQTEQHKCHMEKYERDLETLEGLVSLSLLRLTTEEVLY